MCKKLIIASYRFPKFHNFSYFFLKITSCSFSSTLLPVKLLHYYFWIYYCLLCYQVKIALSAWETTVIFCLTGLTCCFVLRLLSFINYTKLLWISHLNLRTFSCVSKIIFTMYMSSIKNSWYLFIQNSVNGRYGSDFILLLLPGRKVLLAIE